MTTESDPRTRTVLSWLREDVHENAERVLLRALDEVDSTPQRRPSWSTRRTAPMNRPTFASLAAAAAIVALIVFQLARAPESGGTPSGSPPLSVATVSPQPTAAVPTVRPPAIEVAIGPSFGLPVSLVLPDDWAPLSEKRGQADFARTGSAYPYLGFFLLNGVYLDPCHPETGLYVGGGGAPPLGHSHPPTPAPRIPAARIATGLRGFAGAFESTPSVRVTVGGLAAERFAISNQVDTETAGCTEGELLPLFVTTSGDDVSTNGGTTQEIWVIPTLGLLIVGEVGSNPADLQLLEAIVASIRLDATAAEKSASQASVQVTKRRAEVGDGVRIFADFDLPNSWTSRSPIGAVPFAFSPVGATYPNVGFFLVENVYIDPCHPALGIQPNPMAPTLTQSEVVVGLTSLRGFQAGPVSTVRIGDRLAKHFELSNEIDTTAAGCTNGDVLPLFAVSDERDVDASTSGGNSQAIWVIPSDTGVAQLVVVADLGPNPEAAYADQLDQIIKSIEIV